MCLSFAILLHNSLIFISTLTLSIVYQNSVLLLNNFDNFITLINYFSIITSSYISNFFYYSFIFFCNQETIHFISISKVPNSLVIGYNIIHPILVYVSLFWLFFFLKNDLVIKNSVLSTCIVICIALILGSYWGLGNSVWGYFWVNDSIELILLFITLLFFSILHIELNKYITIYLFIILLSLFNSLFLLRFGFFFTKHSFIVFSNIVNFLFLFLVSPLTLFFYKCSFNLFYYFICCLIYYFIYLLINFFNKIIKFKLLILHLIIIAIFFSWLKYGPNNFSYFVSLKKVLCIFFFSQSVILNNFSYLILLIKKLEFLDINGFFFMIKYILSTVSYPHYCGFFIFLFILVSILKIYSK